MYIVSWQTNIKKRQICLNLPYRKTFPAKNSWENAKNIIWILISLMLMNSQENHKIFIFVYMQMIFQLISARYSENNLIEIFVYFLWRLCNAMPCKYFLLRLFRKCSSKCLVNICKTIVMSILMQTKPCAICLAMFMCIDYIHVHGMSDRFFLLSKQ